MYYILLYIKRKKLYEYSTIGKIIKIIGSNIKKKSKSIGFNIGYKIFNKKLKNFINKAQINLILNFNELTILFLINFMK